jgi:hypothetical protein
MTRSRVKTIATVLTAIVIAVLGIGLGRYAEADDAPGGVVIASVMIIGAVVLGVSPWLRSKAP